MWIKFLQPRACTSKTSVSGMWTLRVCAWSLVRLVCLALQRGLCSHLGANRTSFTCVCPWCSSGVGQSLPSLSAARPLGTLLRRPGSACGSCPALPAKLCLPPGVATMSVRNRASRRSPRARPGAAMISSSLRAPCLELHPQVGSSRPPWASALVCCLFSTPLACTDFLHAPSLF